MREQINNLIDVKRKTPDLSDRVFSAVASTLLGLALLSPGATAKGDLVTYSTSTSPTARVTDFTQRLTLPTFRKSLGRLTGVILTYTVTENFQGSLTNNSAIAQTFSVAETGTFKLSMGGTLVMTNSVAASKSFTNLAAKSTGLFGPTSKSGSPGLLRLTSGSIFNAFNSGQSTVALDFSTLTTTRVMGGGGNILTRINSDATATITVQYIYAASPNVPEPPSIALALIGGIFTGSGWWVARRRKRALSAG